MAIPDGYRLLTKNDLGKTFGVDLDPVIYIDTSVTPIYKTSGAGANNYFIYGDADGSKIARFYSLLNKISCTGNTLYNSTKWDITNANNLNLYNLTTYHRSDYTNIVFKPISSWNTTNQNWNNWLYVKDKKTAIGNTTFNNQPVEHIKYNSNDVAIINYNGVKVWERTI